MELQELKNIRSYNDENDLIRILEKIGDKILAKVYDEKEILALVSELAKADLLSMKYETREEILNVLCDAVSYYDIRSKIKWENILEQKEQLEDDLKEYVKDFLCE